MQQNKKSLKKYFKEKTHGIQIGIMDIIKMSLGRMKEIKS